jgi:hypothetical protein
VADTLSELARETETLRRMLESIGWQFRPLTLEPDARPRLKAFWETLGWSESLADAFVEPTYAVAQARARERFEAWHLNEMTKLNLADLPERYRVVEDDGQGVGFLIADETAPGDEPPLKFVSCDRNTIKPVKGSYTRRVADHLVQQALKSRTKCSLVAEPRPLPGEPLLPTLCPGLVRLTSEIWVHYQPEFVAGVLYYPTKKALFDWLETPEVAKLQAVRLGMPDGTIPHPLPVRELLELLASRQDLPSQNDQELCAFGTMFGARVIVGGHEDAHPAS